MGTDWKQDQKRVQRFVPEIKVILAQHFVSEAPAEEDQQHNTDLMVLLLDKVRVACRVRRHHYLAHRDWKDQFTIRAQRPRGNKTELDKIIEGWGDFFFYGFADQDDAKLQKWILGDLKVFRLWFSQQLAKGQEASRWLQANRDGSSLFFAFWNHEMPYEFWVAGMPPPVPPPPSPPPSPPPPMGAGRPFMPQGKKPKTDQPLLFEGL